MESAPQAVVCPNCGAPLKLDVEGRCGFCHALIRQAASAETGTTPWAPGTRSLVPQGWDDDLAEPAWSILSALADLSSAEAVEQSISERGLLEPGLALAAAVAAAGRRARSGRPAKHAGSAIHIIELHLEDYTNEEMWTFDLGADLVTMLSGNRRFALPPHITRKLDDRGSRKAVQEAADGPEGLRPLRSQVPHRG